MYKMDKKRNSINNTALNISGSLVSPQANSTRIVSSFISSPNQTGIKRKPVSPLSSRTAMSKTSLGTIYYNRSLDPQTYSDITSQGLTSRLVKYGGNTSANETPKPNPIRSAFIKNSPFPVIKLKKDSNKPTAQRSMSLSSVRIAPPEKVTFQPNARSNILRSGMMVSMQNLGNPNRSDNEPLNPASSDHHQGVNPTRSVLDALQEISRKRINNEELDTERIKKQCKNLSEVDGPSTTNQLLQNTISDFSGTISDLVYRSPMIQKRGRDTQQGQTSPSSTELEKQKKRLCTKNNEVLSSLSSSMSLATPKRHPTELNTRKGLDLRAPPEDTPMMTLPGSVIVIQQQLPIRSGVIKEVPHTNLVVQVPISRKDIGVVKIPEKQKKVSVAPKLTLFNKKYDDTVIRIDPEENDKKRSRFVKPKEVDEDFQLTSVKKVDQSKLAVLLKCLAGELDDDESEDMVDTAKKEAPKEEVAPKLPPTEPAVIQIPTQPVIPVPLIAEKSSEEEPTKDETESTSSQKLDKPNVSFNLPQTTTTNTSLIQQVPVSKPMFSFGVSSGTTTTTTITPISISTSTVTSSNNISSISSGTELISSPPKTSTNTSVLFGNISNTDALPKPLISAPTSAFTAPNTTLQSGFSFGTNNSSQSSTTTTTVSNVSQSGLITTTPSLSFGTGNETKTSIPAFGTGSTNTTSNSLLTVSSSAAPTIISSAFTTPAPTSVFGSNSFDATKNQVASQPSTNTGFNLTGTPSLAQNQSNSVFVTPNVNSNPVTTTSSIFGSTTPASNTFTFGQTTSKPEVPTPIPTTNPQTVSFGGTTPSVTSPSSTSFNFGASAVPAPSFGQNSIFGQNTTTSAANQSSTTGGFSFKTSATNQNQGGSGGFSFTGNTNNTNQGQNESQKGSVFNRLGPGTAKTTSSAFPTAVVSPSKSLFTFSSPNQGNTDKGAAPQSTFGGNLTNVSNISQTSNIFGGNTTIGGNNNTTQNTTIFGNNSTNNQSSTNLFGTPQQNTQQQPKEATIFGSGASTTFGNSGFGSNVASPPASNTTFGQKGAFSFGSSGNNNTNNAGNNNNNTPFTFGQSSNQQTTDNNKPFAFGVSSPPAYPGGSQGSQSSTQEPPKFNFSSQGPTNNSPFGQQGNNNSAPPTFGSSSITPTPGAFNFSAAGNNNNNNVFGTNSDGSTTASSAGGAFNFSANQAPGPQDGLAFNIGTGGQQTGRRQFRQATRRLNK